MLYKENVIIQAILARTPSHIKLWDLEIVAPLTEKLKSGFYLQNNFNNCEFKI